MFNRSNLGGVPPKERDSHCAWLVDGAVCVYEGYGCDHNHNVHMFNTVTSTWSSSLTTGEYSKCVISSCALYEESKKNSGGLGDGRICLCFCILIV